MDIVTRLKFFMDSMGIQSSQFADTCAIPRPTLSQLLNGRNKKISDEIISKVHAAFPELSVMWLLFGEGDMRAETNIKISTPQNHEAGPILSSHQPVNEAVDNCYADNLFAEKNYQNNNSDNPRTNMMSTEDASKTPIYGEQRVLTNNIIESSNNSTSKKITSILVFYDDNSFESFKPSHEATM